MSSVITQLMQKDKFLKRLGAQIVKIRKSKNLTQAELAWKCGKDPQSIERVENGKTNPTSYYLFQLASALNVSTKSFFEFLEDDKI